jgi:hypothetical protein
VSLNTLRRLSPLLCSLQLKNLVFHINYHIPPIGRGHITSLQRHVAHCITDAWPSIPAATVSKITKIMAKSTEYVVIMTQLSNQNNFK